MRYNLWSNIVLLCLGISILTFLLWKENSIDRIRQSAINKYYYWFIGIFMGCCIISNAIQTYMCTRKLVDIGGSVLYTILGWLSFIIVVVYHEYLRIPFANVLGYIIYSSKIEDSVNEINQTISEQGCSSSTDTPSTDGKDTPSGTCPKDTERSIFEICTLLRSGSLFDASLLYLWPQLKHTNGVSNTSISSTDTSSLSITNDSLAENVSKLFMTCYLRDIIGETVLFALVGIMCIFIYEYLTSKYICIK